MNRMEENEVYLDNCESNQRLQEFVEIISRADRRCLAEVISERSERKVELDSQIEICDRKVIKNSTSHSTKKYNLTQTAHLLKVHRQTIYYWLKKGWVKLKRDYRDYPVFTVLDIENIIKWRNPVK